MAFSVLCRFARIVVRAESRADLRDKTFGGFQGQEMATLVHDNVAGQIRIGPAQPGFLHVNVAKQPPNELKDLWRQAGGRRFYHELAKDFLVAPDLELSQPISPGRIGRRLPRACARVPSADRPLTTVSVALAPK